MPKNENSLMFKTWLIFFSKTEKKIFEEFQVLPIRMKVCEVKKQWFSLYGKQQHQHIF